MAPNPWDAGQQYANETYLRSLATSGEDVKRQVSNTLSEIARQRAVAGAQTAQIPGAAGAEFARAQGTMGADLSGLGIAPSQAVQDALTNESASYGRAAGLLNQGFGEQETQRRGAAQSAQQQLLSDLIAKGNTYVSGRQSEDRQRKFQEEESARQAALQREMQDRQAALQRSLLAAQRGGGGGGGYRAPAPAPAGAGNVRRGNPMPLAVQEYDNNFNKALAAYGPGGGLTYLARNPDRPNGLSPDQVAWMVQNYRPGLLPPAEDALIAQAVRVAETYRRAKNRGLL